jgi:threonine synthase
MVPVSVRGEDERGHLGNRLATMRAPLPVYEEDPVARLEIVTAAMDGLKQSGSFTLPETMLEYIRNGFSSGRTDEAQTAETIRQTLAETGELLDPHTAVGYAVALQRATAQAPMVTLATAHPAKFPDAVEAASGVRPQLPPRLGDLMSRTEVYDVLPNDLDAVKQYIGSRTRAAGGA